MNSSSPQNLVTVNRWLSLFVLPIFWDFRVRDNAETWFCRTQDIMPQGTEEELMRETKSTWIGTRTCARTLANRYLMRLWPWTPLYHDFLFKSSKLLVLQEDSGTLRHESTTPSLAGKLILLLSFPQNLVPVFCDSTSVTRTSFSILTCGERQLRFLFLFWGCRSHHGALPSPSNLNVIASPRPHLQTASHWGSGLQRTLIGGTQTSNP